MGDIIEKHINFLKSAIQVEKNCIKIAKDNSWCNKLKLHRNKLKGYQDALANIKFLLKNQKKAG